MSILTCYSCWRILSLFWRRYICCHLLHCRSFPAYRFYWGTESRCQMFHWRSWLTRKEGKNINLQSVYPFECPWYLSSSDMLCCSHYHIGTQTWYCCDGLWSEIMCIFDRLKDWLSQSTSFFPMWGILLQQQMRRSLARAKRCAVHLPGRMLGLWADYGSFYWLFKDISCSKTLGQSSTSPLTPCSLTRVYSASQVSDHKLYHSVYSENPEAFTMSILRSTRYNPGSVYNAMPGPDADAWDARPSMDSVRDVPALHGGYSDGSQPLHYEDNYGKPQNYPPNYEMYPPAEQQGGQYAFATPGGGYVDHPAETRTRQEEGTPMANQYSGDQGLGYSGVGTGLRRPEEMQNHPDVHYWCPRYDDRIGLILLTSEGLFGRKTPKNVYW